MLSGLKSSLQGLVASKFESAKASQSLTFSSTELAVIESGTDVSFQLRYCPALAKKPQKDDSEKAKDKPKKPDPFENPDEALLITEFPQPNPSHFLVLNKYTVIPEHFILATKQNKQQTALLEQDDLDATYACLKAWETDNSSKRLFAFFNSGEHSGASQAHRHVQFLPVESMVEDESSGKWKILIDLIEQQGQWRSSYPETMMILPVPFLNFGLPIHPHSSPSQLYNIYTRLLEAAESSVRSYISAHPNALSLHSTENSACPISYNLALTTTFMAICPRKSEGYVLRRDDKSEIGIVALNGTILAGTLMVKGEEEWELLKRDKASFDEILGAIGIPGTGVGIGRA
ncbi:MAG: bifunctional AP-4-A phosphorylase/ADP sulfurylase [Bogoriella megaspora]|nr:MAG: bifunctional AP-4-A phosphorylase/ADP sulfurylase [Bogoriella megaspora]